MSLDDVFQEVLTQSCTITTFSSKDKWGADTQSTGVSYPCREEAKQHLVVNAEGREVVARHIAYVGESSTGGLPTNLTPDGEYTSNDGTTYPIISVDSHPDSDAQHVVVHLG